MPATDDVVSSFQRDDMTIAARRARDRGHKRRALPTRRDALAPTPERLAKLDHPVKLGAGLYRAPMPIERMRDRKQLDPSPYVNEALFLAAEKLVGLFEGAQLAACVKSVDFSRVVAGGVERNDERAAHCLTEFRKACTLMGWSVAYPHRGAGRITVAVVCEGQGVREAAAIHRPGGSSSGQLGAGMDALREGLFTLAVHWRLLRG